MEEKRVTVFTGNFGSGKTEISLNYALHLKEQDNKVAVIDLDTINPYFRSREKNELMEEYDIEVVYPKELKYADLPIITPNIKKYLQNEDYHGIIDVGGEEDGAKVLASIAGDVEKTDYEINLVINTKRPFTDNVEGIIKMKEKIESASKMAVNNLICNINLGKDTTIEDIKQDYHLVKKASEKLNLPIKFISVRKDLQADLKKLDYKEDIFIIDRLLKNPWD